MSLRSGLGALVFLATACGDDIPDASAQATFGTAAEASSTGVGTTNDESADAGSTAALPEEIVLELDLQLEIRAAIDITFTRVGDDLFASAEVGRDYGVAATGVALTGPARIDAYPEVGGTVYTARLAGPPIDGGRCGDEPLSLALSLHTEDGTDYIAGGLAAYCGADRWYGVPVIEPLRISGRLQAR